MFTKIKTAEDLREKNSEITALTGQLKLSDKVAQAAVRGASFYAAGGVLDAKISPVLTKYEALFVATFEYLDSKIPAATDEDEREDLLNKAYKEMKDEDIDPIKEIANKILSTEKKEHPIKLTLSPGSKDIVAGVKKIVGRAGKADFSKVAKELDASASASAYEETPQGKTPAEIYLKYKAQRVLSGEDEKDFGKSGPSTLQVVRGSTTEVDPASASKISAAKAEQRGAAPAAPSKPTAAPLVPKAITKGPQQQ